jgi:hypothetical protein
LLSRRVASGVEGGLDPKLKLVNLARAPSSEVLIGVTGSSSRVRGTDDTTGGGFGGVGVKYGRSCPSGSTAPAPNAVGSYRPVTLVRSGAVGICDIEDGRRRCPPVLPCLLWVSISKFIFMLNALSSPPPTTSLFSLIDTGGQLPLNSVVSGTTGKLKVDGN